MGRFRFMEQILKIISFIVGAVISVLIFCDKDNKESSSHVKYKEVVIFKEKQLEKGCLPIFVQPTDSDKLNFMKNKEHKSFEDLMTKYLYVPVEEEGLIYALIASNQFKLKEAGSYIYRYLTRDSIGDYTYRLGIKHLEEGVRRGDVQSISDYNYYKLNK